MDSEVAARLLGGEDGWRDTVINWENQLQRVIDDYMPYATIDEAVQKDGIQNSWDGRRNRRRAAGWQCVLELVEDRNRHRFFTITDSGTTGLTGRVLRPEEYMDYMPEEERWARFESQAFTHDPGGDAHFLGARGQGKFIFVGASRQRLIAYDSLRDDGTYRLGVRYVQRTRSPVRSWEGPDAEEMLRQISPDLAPLTEIGTRVVIVDPVDEVTAAMATGAMARNVADTWWPIIDKYDADIRIAQSSPTAERSEIRVSIPDDLRLPREDSRSRKVWFRQNQRLDVAGQRYSIKRAHFVSSEPPPRSELQGVAFVRGGMVVMRLDMPGVPRQIASSVTGYVEFDEALDLEMKKLEHPTHYTFNLRRGAGLRLKHWVEDQLAEFAAAKLGLGGDRRGATERQRRDAERRALEAVNRAARDLGLIGRRGRAGGGGGGGGGGGRPRAPFAVELDAPILPRQASRRVEFGESIQNIRARVFNNTDDPVTVRLSAYLTRGDDVLARFVNNVDLEIQARSESAWTTAHELLLDPDEYESGPYVLRAKALVVASPTLARMLEQKDAFKFWLAEDPPQGGLFEDVVALHYPDDAIRIDAEARTRADGWIFQYNLRHPAYLRVADSDEQLTEYLFELMIREMVYVDLSTGNPILFDEGDLRDHRNQQRKSALVAAGVLYDYYAGA